MLKEFDSFMIQLGLNQISVNFFNNGGFNKTMIFMYHIDIHNVYNLS